MKNILIIISLSLCTLIKAQIYAPTADKARLTTYKNSVSNKSDTIYIFARENANKSLVAHLPDSANADFEWSLFTGSGYAVFKTDLNSSFSDVDGITASGGYKVTINDTSNYYCWVIVQYFEVDITSTIDGDTIPNGDINCRTISYIKAEIIDEDHFYYNPDPPYVDPYLYKPAYQIAWSSFPKEAPVPLPGYSLQVSVEDPYWENTAYIITVTDNDINQSKDDSAFYKSVRPHAEFIEPKAVPLDDSIYYPDKEEWFREVYNSTTYTFKSAPAKYLFDNDSSKNADAYTWIFGDSITALSGPDTIMQHTYNFPGTYYAYLIAKKNVDFLYDPCYDTFPKPGSTEDFNLNKILVDEVRDMPDTGYVNVFTSRHKNGWRLKQDVSIEDIEIAIYSRYGHRVHHFKGNIRDWPGWDGTNNGKKKVSTGVYFFVIKNMKPLPDFETEDLPADLKLLKKGFIHYYNLDD